MLTSYASLQKPIRKKNHFIQFLFYSVWLLLGFELLQYNNLIPDNGPITAYGKTKEMAFDRGGKGIY